MEQGLRDRVPELEKVPVVPKQVKVARDQPKEKAGKPVSARPGGLATAVRAATNRYESD